ncbi:asparagine synthase (glutamine-hydrolyzing) [Mucilaginibacter aquaedulcis]|uniref:asparagine synthase (glutamine-hydrolyzing) n=1 Tax=Mucilaginibacter aquaedulcis TaxID=1187081 RepID=UPI0025B5B9A7|nr:asparagine synthase (glutamine-hydrolyzing) [Mucilaginibacter aquaedulcis]MDN3548750.1 asparagine synthase (glutamine-hydrolyzing) [Mucilaginibacter aquaedulcis]
MCRIAGIIDSRLPLSEIDQRVQTMCRMLQHGGPDDEGVFLDDRGHLGLGHRRLSIIDLSSKGHQPMADNLHQFWITFNGEIYNYPELRNELLKLGAVFRSGTDTEIILAAFSQWGVDAFARLRGMFAFALYDRLNQLTYLVRDTAGIKPIYYLARDGALVFASEIRAFSAAGINTEKDHKWSIRFLAYGHIPEPCTTLKDVFSLPKGHFLRWDNASSSYNITAYGEPQTKNLVTDVHEARQIVYNALTKSVSRQLIADAPVGVFLSGGIDSSLIALIANGQKEKKLKTISIFFNEKKYDEQSYQRKVIDKLDAESFSHLVRQQDFEAAFPHIMKAMDMPTTDGINSWFISKYARLNGLKAVLSGIGADELFGGYPSFNRIKYLKYLRKINPSLFSAFSVFLPDKYKKLAFLTNEHPLADHLLLRGLFSPNEIARLLDADSNEIKETLFNAVPVIPANTYDKVHASWLETNLYMQNQLLRDTDVMSMSHGLEVRVPFLDEDFTAAVASIDPALRFDNRQPKKLLVDSFKDMLPTDIWNRPKMGFTFPLQQWMMQHHAIINVDHYRGKMAKNLIGKFSNNEIHWSKIFALYQIQGHA